MKQLWRRKESDAPLPISDTTEFLDIAEQEKVVLSLETSHSRQSFMWRVIFGMMICTFSIFLLFSAVSQTIFPWEMKYHAYFMDDMNSVSVVIADVVGAVIYAFVAGRILYSERIHPSLLQGSLAAGFALTMFWLYHMQSLSKMHWELLWLPLGPSSCAAFGLYLEHLIWDMEKQIHELRASMYHFKKT